MASHMKLKFTMASHMKLKFTMASHMKLKFGRVHAEKICKTLIPNLLCVSTQTLNVSMSKL